MGVGIGKHVLLLLLCHLLLLLHEAHSKCLKSYPCGNFSLEFPFTNTDNPDCGLFIIENCGSNKLPSIRATSPALLHILGKQTSSNKFLIQDRAFQDLLSLPKCVTLTKLALPHSPSVSFTFSPNITFFTCNNQTPSSPIHDYFKNYRHLDCRASTVYYKTPAATATEHGPAIPEGCELIQRPIKSNVSTDDLLHLLTPNFTLEWNVSQECYECQHGGGQCFADNQNKFYCKTAERDGDDLAEIMHDEDESQLVKRNLMIVGLWCIQTNPKDRPPMTKVVEMLEGKLGSLEVPPKPYLYSPPRSAPSFSASESL